MAYELVYTSVPRGIRSGSSGFCTVAYTKGLAANVALLLESLSAYKAYFPHYDAKASLNPVSFSHCIYNNSGKELHILSRVCFYGTDYTDRSNKLAHHVVVDSEELGGAASGPSSVFRQPELFRTTWEEEPQLFSRQAVIAAPTTPPRKAQCWETYSRDGGWAGKLAEQFMEDPRKTAFIIFNPEVHTDTLKLVEEALLLLPPELRWQVTFNTYFNTLPSNMSCNWRFCVADSPALKEARRNPNVLIIDLNNPVLLDETSPLIESARTGLFASRPAQTFSITPSVNEIEGAMEPRQPQRARIPHGPTAQIRQIRKAPNGANVAMQPQSNNNQRWLFIGITGVVALAAVCSLVICHSKLNPDESPETLALQPEKPVPSPKTDHTKKTDNTKKTDLAPKNIKKNQNALWCNSAFREFMAGTKSEVLLKNILNKGEKISTITFFHNERKSEVTVNVEKDVCLWQETVGGMGMNMAPYANLELKYPKHNLKISFTGGDKKNLKGIKYFTTSKGKKIHVTYGKDSGFPAGHEITMTLSSAQGIKWDSKTKEYLNRLPQKTSVKISADKKQFSEGEINFLLALDSQLEKVYAQAVKLCQKLTGDKPGNAPNTKKEDQQDISGGKAPAPDFKKVFEELYAKHREKIDKKHKWAKELKEGTVTLSGLKKVKVKSFLSLPDIKVPVKELPALVTTLEKCRKDNTLCLVLPATKSSKEKLIPIKVIKAEVKK